MTSRPHLEASALQRACDIKSTQVYCCTAKGSNAPVKLRIATGGAGQSGLLRALANAFTDDHISETECPPFAIAWIKFDTTASFNHLADNSDLEGPKSNPANLTVSSSTTIEALFSQLFIAAIASDNTVRFVSRSDKSATDIKESAIWASIGQTPWSCPFSFFYHINPGFPYQALATAAKLQEYTLIDRGTWYGVEPWIREEMQIFLGLAHLTQRMLYWTDMLTENQTEGRDDDKTDTLLNPARALVGAYGENKAMADAFGEWIVRPNGVKML